MGYAHPGNTSSNHPHNQQPQDHPLAMGGAPTTAGAPQTLPLAAVSSPSARYGRKTRDRKSRRPSVSKNSGTSKIPSKAKTHFSSSAGGLRHDSTPLSGDTPGNQHNDSVSDAGWNFRISRTSPNLIRGCSRLFC